MLKYIDLNFLQTDWQEISQLNKKMAAQLPYLVNLNPDERKRFGRMKEIHSGLVEKTVEYATKQPAILPGFISLDALKEKIAGAKQLQKAIQDQEMLMEGMQDTLLAAKSCIHRNILDIYASVGRATAYNIVGIDSIMADLKQYFEKFGIKGEVVEELIQEAMENGAAAGQGGTSKQKAGQQKNEGVDEAS